MTNRSFSRKSILYISAIITGAHGCGLGPGPTGDDDDRISLQPETLSATPMSRHFFAPQSLNGPAKTDLAASSTPAIAALASAAAVSHAGIAWEFRGFPSGAARIAGCMDGSIYALNFDKTIWRNTSGGSDSGWVFIGTASDTQDITCSNRLYAFDTNRSLWRNDGTPTSLAWTLVGLPSGAKQVTAGWRIQGSDAPALFALNDDNTFWQSATGADGSWTQIGLPGAADRVSAGRTGIWALNTNKTLYRGNGRDTGWTFLDTPSSAAQISDDGSVESGALWALNTDNHLYHGRVIAGAAAPPTTGVTWQLRGQPGSADRIAGCQDGSIYALNTDKSLWRNTSGGSDAGWGFIGTVSDTQDITCSNKLYAFDTNRSLWRNDGTATSLSWTEIGQPTGAKQISAGWGIAGLQAPALFALNDDDSLWQSPTGADGTWTRIGTPSSADRIAAGRTGLWALNFDKTLWRGNGNDSGWQLKGTILDTVQISDDSSLPAGSLWALDTNKTLWHGTLSQAPSGIEFQGGSVIGGAATVYYIWYGTWSSTDQAILTDLASTLGGSYWNINTTYTDGSGAVPSSVLAYGGSTTRSTSTHGTTLVANASRDDVKAIVQDAINARSVPVNNSGIYVVMAGTEVTMAGFCSAFCAYHTAGTLTNPNGGSFAGKYAIVLDAGARCSSCTTRFSPTPNGSLSGDSAATVTAHEVMESVTDPLINAWFDPSISGVNENGDNCAWTWGTTYRTSSNATANVKLGSRDYLLQQNWINTGAGGCGLSVP